MRDLGKHRYHAGDTVGRWTVVRHAAPKQCPDGRNRLIWRRRLSVRCVCGFTEIVLERTLVGGMSRGCPSKTCMHAEQTRQEIAWLAATQEHAAEMRRLADEAELVAADAAIRIKAAREKLDGLTSKLAARTWRRAS